MKRLAILGTLILTGCQTTAPLPPVTAVVSGPKLPSSQLDCGERPLPPDPVKRPTAKDAAHYEGAIAAWGQGCKNKLESVGVTLHAADQVVGE